MNFSVLMSVYSKEKPEYFNQAFLSIWDQQTLKPDQVVLVKDGLLTPELDALIEQWQTKLSQVLTLVELPHNVGLGAALNTGLQACRNDLVARMDTDDIARRDRFSLQVEYMNEHPECDVVGSYVVEIDSQGSRGRTRRMPVHHEEIFRLLWACPLIHPTVVIRKSRVLSVGGYDTKMRRRQDYELWFRCALNGIRFHNLPHSLLYYRFVDHTHRRQSKRLAWQQGIVGYTGSRSVGLPVQVALLAFVPFMRSLMPVFLQHPIYKTLSVFDPRKGNGSI